MRDRVEETTIEIGSCLIIPWCELVRQQTDLRPGRDIEGELAALQESTRKCSLVVTDGRIAGNLVAVDLPCSSFLSNRT